MHFEKLLSTNRERNYLTGYYDKRVITPNGKKLCCIEVPFTDRLPNLNDLSHSAKVTLFDLTTNRYEDIDSTLAWNFQQGCGLQFINDGRSLIYLDSKHGKVKTKIVNLEDEQIKEIDHAYYSYSADMNGFVGINHERYSVFRPSYSYPLNSNFKTRNYDPDDGIYFYDLSTKENKQIIKFRDLDGFRSPIDYRQSVNYLEHLTFSPDGMKFVFVHRFVTPEEQLYSRLFLYDFASATLNLLHYSGRVTHFNWLDSEKVILWQGGNTLSQWIKNKQLVRKHIKPILSLYKKLVKANSEVGMNKVSRAISGDCYGVIDVSSKRLYTSEFAEIMHDGHPSVAGENTIISDTYPYGARNTIDLYSYNYKTKERNLLKQIPHPRSLNLTAMRCDAHPKVDEISRTITIDTFVSDARQVEVYCY